MALLFKSSLLLSQPHFNRVIGLGHAIRGTKLNPAFPVKPVHVPVSVVFRVVIPSHSVTWMVTESSCSLSANVPAKECRQGINHSWVSLYNSQGPVFCILCNENNAGYTAHYRIQEIGHDILIGCLQPDGD